MKHFTQSKEQANRAQTFVSGIGMAVLFVSTLLLPGLAFAADGDGTVGGDFADTGKTVCGFFSNINSLLNMASIAVVTISVIFSGYQIAFNNKRISEVATILIGGVLIGAAGQIARMLLGGNGDACGSIGATPGGFILLAPWLS